MAVGRLASLKTGIGTGVGSNTTLYLGTGKLSDVTINIVNQGFEKSLYSVGISSGSISGVTTSDYIIDNAYIDPRETQSINVGIKSGDLIFCKASKPDVSFIALSTYDYSSGLSTYYGREQGLIINSNTINTNLPLFTSYRSTKTDLFVYNSGFESANISFGVSLGNENYFTDSDYIVYAKSIAPKEVYVVKDIPVGDNQSIIVRSSKPNVAFNVNTLPADPTEVVSSSGGGSGGATILNDLSDVTLTSLSAGQVLKYDGTKWVNGTDIDTDTVGAGGTWATDSVGINTIKSVGIGTTAKNGYKLYVEGDARVTGILTVGPASVTIDGINNKVSVGAGITLYGNTGIISATSLRVTGALIGSGSALTGLTGASAAIYGNETAVPQITVDANGRITTISNVLISGGGGGGGSSVIIQDSQSIVGTAGTIDFGTGLSVSPVSAGIVTVTSDFDLTNLSVTTNAAGTAALSYNNATGQFTYTPPNLSSYLTSYTETDPVVGAINGIVKANGGGTISAATAGTDYLTPTGDGSALTGITSTTAEWTLGANGSSDYTFTGPGVADGAQDPTIYLVRGQTYKFKNRTGSHPFRIQYEFQNTGGTAYTDGIVISDGSSASSGAGNNADLYWEVRNDAPDLLYYQCTSHTDMSGRIVILGDVVSNGSWTASAGTPQTIDTITGISNNNIKTAEYTIHIENGSNMQAQKVLVMQDGTTAYSQEYGVMHKSGLLVSMGATISSGNLLLQATPKTGVSGTTTYKITRQTMR